MYHGFLRLGGVDVVNTERARGYATTADCPTWMIKERPCPSINEALFDEPYIFQNMPLAPWYDQSLPDVSSRFYGVYGVEFSGLADSTRQAAVTQGVAAGGTIGRSRKGVKQPRVRATLLARGGDAMDYGMSWLNSAFDGACGQHGDGCGTMDMEFLIDCPPRRADVPDYSAWEQTALNLITNPGMASVAGTIDLHRNLFKDPDITNIALWAGTSGVPTLASGNRIQFNGLAGGSARLGITHTLDSKNPAGTYMLSAELQTAAAEATSARVILLDTTGSAIRATTTLPKVAGGGVNRYDFLLTPTGDWDRIYVEFTGTAIPQTATGFMGKPIIGLRSVVVPFFSPGQGSGKPDLIAVWAGAANASSSILRGNRPSLVNTAMSNALVYQSTEWADAGPYSLKVDPTGGVNASYGSVVIPGLTPGATYTAVAKIRLAAEQVGTLHPTWLRQLMAQSTGMPVNNVVSNRAPNEVGVHEVRVTFTLGASDTVTLFTMNGSLTTPIWFDSFTLVSGLYEGTTFDGSTPESELARYAWTATPNGSTSTKEQRIAITRPQTDAEYLAIVDPYRRFMHSVGVTSGPIVVSSRVTPDGKLNVTTVEWTITAERPWVYSSTRKVELPTTETALIQDVPFNLFPYPSAEVAGADVILATNFSTNPSVEVNATGWVAAKAAGVPGTFVGARVVNELRAVGTASFRGVFTPGVAGATADFWLEQTVDISTRPAGSRISINIWAAIASITGSHNLFPPTILAYWLDGPTGNVLRTDTLGAVSELTLSGAISAKSLVPPTGATHVRVQARASASSYTADTVIRIYADALAVTAP